jgi:xeroderma pigmentosum group C-complementing protein
VRALVSHFDAMPPKKRAAARTRTTSTRKSARRAVKQESTVPDVFQEMLEEVGTSPEPAQSARPAKRRKVANDVKVKEFTALSGQADQLANDEDANENAVPQTVYDDFEDSDDDAEFEDVDLDVSEGEDKPEIGHITVELDGPVESPKKVVQRRPIASAAERKMRLEWHKAHLFLLLLSVWCRNRWCESQDVHRILKPLVPRKTVKLLHEDETKPQVQRSYSFNKGIEEVCQLWRTSWTTTARGMRRAVWRDDINAEKESDMAEELDFDDFKTAAHTRRGSRDLGAQLFCALLRSIAIEARLVCSLQVLTFSAAAKGQTPQKSKPEYTYAPLQDFGSTATQAPRSKTTDSPYPIYWVEVFSPASSTWVPLDPLVRHTINKPKTGFEPPASDMLNSMSYVVAFEDDGSARDVTQRYTQWYNAKTRKIRVESTKGGEEWWKTTLAPFMKPFPELRDELEDADLLRRSQTEGLPKNVQDFKGHPVYVLERHLRLNEVIHPKREVGKTTIGNNQKSSKLESVYRRSDVYLCRSADAWYRRGRDIKQGEVPLKRLKKKVRADPFDEDGGGLEEAILYAEFQTEVYEPPAVEHGRIPRNGFGNIDIYVPSMIPAGAVHVQHPLAAKAAKLMGIDYVEAVTGFDFKGRQGTAIINGVVVSTDVRFGLVAVIVGMQTQAVDEVQAERTALLLALWKRWLIGLRIRARIHRDYGGDEEMEVEEDESYKEGGDRDGGGFMPDEAELAEQGEDPMEAAVADATSRILLKGLPEEPAQAEIVVVESPHKMSISTKISPEAPRSPGNSKDTNGNQAGGFFAESESGGGFFPVSEAGGGFLVEDDSKEMRADLEANTEGTGAGGFIIEDDHTIPDDDDRVSSHAVLDQSLKQLRDPDPNLKTHDLNGSFFYPSANDKVVIVSKTNSSDKPLPVVEEVAPTPTTGRPTEYSDAMANDAASEAGDQATPTSMLSHDPDEDDLEPEWLVDSLGD